MSYEDFLAFVEEDRHAEWANGEVTVSILPSSKHQVLQSWLARMCALFVDLSDLGEIHGAPLEMRAMPGGSAPEPDVLFVAREHLDRLEARRLNGPADLIIEIISPEIVRRDRVEKFREHAVAGVPEYWLFDARPSPDSPAWSRLNDAGEYEPIQPDAAGRLRSAILPSFWLDPVWLTREPLPKPLAVLGQIAPRALRAAVETGA